MEFENLIHAKIKENKGVITFRDYMEMALYHETYGYYRKDIPLIGKKGDFVTSPHTGPFFGALIAVQLKNLFDISGRSAFNIVEMGAGHGFLAKDILDYLMMYENEFYKKTRYIIIEPAQPTMDIQKTNLKKFLDNVVFYQTMDELPELEGCVLSNELLDAFPVHLIEKKQGVFHEVGITVNNDNQLKEVLVDIKKETPLFTYIKERVPKDLPDGYRTEVNMDIINWLDSLNSKLLSGFIFTIDYGHSAKDYFNNARNRGTLLCYREHQVNENYLEYPGSQDITAHVNFSDLHHWGKLYGFTTIGYNEQWAFLGGLDFEKTYIKIFKKIDPFSKELNAVKMLIMPHCMGATHKVMIQVKDIDVKTGDIKGFKLRNIMDRL
jgi:SAM-dependent MidA family methyltransferase